MDLASKMLFGSGCLNEPAPDCKPEHIPRSLPLTGFISSRSSILILLASILVLRLVSPVPARADDPIVVTPSAGIENGGLAFGANLRYFFLPNLGGEIDGGYGDSLCQNCHLSETTLTANLVYEIHPVPILSFFVVAGGGVGLLALSSPESGRTVLDLFDLGFGSTLNLTKNIGLTLEDRWFFPLTGQLPNVTGGNLTADRIFLGVSTAF